MLPVRQRHWNYRQPLQTQQIKACEFFVLFNLCQGDWLGNLSARSHLHNDSFIIIQSWIGVRFAGDFRETGFLAVACVSPVCGVIFSVSKNVTASGFDFGSVKVGT
jgi:hypothetical protein